MSQHSSNYAPETVPAAVRRDIPGGGLGPLVRQLWSRSSNTLRTSVLLAVLGIAILWVGIQVHLNYRSEAILGGRVFTPLELMRLEAAFSAKNLTSYRVVQGQIQVPIRERGAYLRVLNDEKVLPHSLDQSAEATLRIGSPLESQAQRTAREQAARNQELASFLRLLPGIDDASVRIDESVGRGLRAQPELKAMVVIKTKPNYLLLPEQIAAIRDLVAASRVGLQAEDVTILDLCSGQSFSMKTPDSPQEQARLLSYRKQSYEQYWTTKVQELLQQIPDVTVAAEVSMDARTLSPGSVRISIGVPREYCQAVVHECKTGAGPRAQDVEPTSGEQAVCTSIHKSVARLLSPLEASGIASSVHVTTNDSTWRATQATGWDQPNLLAAAMILVLAMLVGSMAVGGFVRDLWGTRFRRVNTLVQGPERESSRSVSPLDAESARADMNSPGRQDHVEQRARRADELARLVNQDPGTAAAVLRSWVEPAA